MTPNDMTPNEAEPVVIAGAGNAALTAAIAAADAGARVIVLESAAEAGRGGNTYFTGALFRCTWERDEQVTAVTGTEVGDYEVEPYSADDYVADLVAAAHGNIDEAQARFVAETSYDVVLWLAGLGVPWVLNTDIGTFGSEEGARQRVPRGAAVRVKGKGAGLSDALFAIAAEKGVEIRYSTTAVGLVVEDGAVNGVRVADADGGESVIATRAVVLAAGGFQASAAMRRSFLGASWGRAKLRGTTQNTGRLHLAALAAGAQPWGEWSRCHATMIDAAAPDPPAKSVGDTSARLSYPFGVLLNANGRRFVDEAADFHLHTYARIGELVLEQPHGVAFQIFDAAGAQYQMRSEYRTATPLQADTLEELAALMEWEYSRYGVTAKAVLDEIASYNRSAKPGPVDPSRLDGLRTDGLEIPKSNWAARLETAPFTCHVVRCGITFTYGGLKVDTDAAVLDRDDRPIPGLFASGEILGGLFSDGYPGAAGLARGAVYGRAAGRSAAALVRGAS
jgi:tricarballylate dehydrogenase